MDQTKLQARMHQALDIVVKDLSSIRTGKAASSLVEDLMVRVYGGTQNLKIVELATISAPGPEALVIDPWDKSIIGEIRQGIQAANIGMNPVIDGQIIRVNLPPLTTEDRERYVKLLSVKLEAGKITVRQIRGDEMHKIKKEFEEKDISEDDKFNQEKELQETIDEFIAKIEEIGEKKKQELLQI
ncbi:ribosome recycling factor [Candidatus Woesebacteria bacterium RIFCSPHIGHO2_02_FULL_38_9]|uniref:Ribosome recycling factor n=1 Tax=Candidatus Woesebacteria bacterium RIFCSPHIGHO2_01_FULL_39_28 TaxID=1802496 RepID=A0A1F7YHZ3_9BACT|nr:MAG: ribosome recycling factor [Candidatus Woesebacteria bacterium RIFCSPHIGHO2_01_FULL_39_28]OGM33646.1 MAG: ribosome recycling factor [Candidatus Woesebacteria bacterium RIFCSPHIGHO2_02_FULL_38_9]OGM58533.1 MAG: ribosome recycling factor [Candidatus Woesebacteria bacterium RIFCSPLOWO2_01_FULL_38_20]